MRDKLKDEEYLRERYNKDNARYTKYMTTYQTKLSNPDQYDIRSCKYHAFIFAFYKFYSGYSLGLDINELLPDIKLIIQNLIETRKERDYITICLNRSEFHTMCLLGLRLI